MRVRGLGTAVLFGTIVSTVAVTWTTSMAVTPAAAVEPTTTFATSESCSSYVVPADVNQIDVELIGGNGFPGGGPNSPGGRGGHVTARLEVDSGITLYGVVAANGGGTGKENKGGGSRLHGGRGGDAAKEWGFPDKIAYGGGGGGASFLSTDNAHCLSTGLTVDANSVLAVAGGGGGGGHSWSASEHGGAGGDAGAGGGGSVYCDFLFGCSNKATGGGAGTLTGTGAGGANGGGSGFFLFSAPSSVGTGFIYNNGGDVVSGNNFGGGGGGGWFGGGQGGNQLQSFGGGGGGSSYVQTGRVIPSTTASLGINTTGASPTIRITPVAVRRLTVTPAGAGSGTVTSTDAGASINCGTTCKGYYPTGTTVTLQATAAAGSRFAGWSGGGCSGTSSTCTVTMTAAQSVTATYTKIHRVTIVVGFVSPAGSGSVSANPAGFPCGQGCIDFDEGTNVTFTATPNAVSVFRHWNVACTGTQTTCNLTVVDRDLTVHADFTENVLSVVKQGAGTGRVVSEPAGIDCGSDCSNFYPWGTVVELTATPDPGSFAQWLAGGCQIGLDVCQVRMEDGSRAVPVQFLKVQKQLFYEKTGTGQGRIVSDPAAIDCGSGCGDSWRYFEQFTDVTLTATALTGTPFNDSVFTGWTVAGRPDLCTDPAQPCSVPMDVTYTVQARFTQIPKFDVVTTWVGPGTGTVSSDVGDIVCGSFCRDDYYSGTVVTLTATPDAASSTFAGWAQDCTNTSGPCQLTVTQGRNATAMFELIPRHLTVSTSGTGTGEVGFLDLATNTGTFHCPGTCERDIPHGHPVSLTVDPADNANFAGWTGACSGQSFTCQVTMDQARTVNAEFTRNVRTLTVATAGIGTGTVTGDRAGVGGVDIDCGTSCTAAYDYGTLVELTATPGLNSRFTGWSGACGGSSGPCNVLMYSHQSATANFEINRLTVTRTGAGTGRVVADTGGIDCGTACTADYATNTVVELTPIADAGSAFVGWDGPGSCFSLLGPCHVTVAGARTATARFELTQTINVVLIGSGAAHANVTDGTGKIFCGSQGTKCTTTLLPGASITLQQSTEGGSSTTFDGWSGPCSGTGACTFTPNQEVTVFASYTRHTNPYTVTKSGTGTGRVVSSTPAGIDCGATCEAPFGTEDNVTMTYEADAGSEFIGWTGACNGFFVNCSVPTSVARTVDARFDLIPFYPLTIQKTGTGRGTVTADGGLIDCGATCTGSYIRNSFVWLEATVGANSTFENWGGLACLETTLAGRRCKVQVNNALTMEPRFTLLTTYVEIHTANPSVNGATGTGTVDADVPGLNCSGSVCIGTFERSTTVTFVAVPTNNSTFLGFANMACQNSDANATLTCQVAMSGNVIGDALFVHAPMRLTLNPVGNGGGTIRANTSISGVPSKSCSFNCTTTWPWGSGMLVIVEALPDDGSERTGWSGCPQVVSNNCWITIGTNDVTLSAGFDLHPIPLTVERTGNGTGSITSAPAGIDCGTTCVKGFPPDTLVTLTANIGAYSDFAGWGGACSGTDLTCTVTMNEARTVSASIRSTADVTVTLAKAGNGSGIVASAAAGINCGSGCNGLTVTRSRDSQVTLTATAYSDNIFNGWSGACTNVSGTCTVTFDAAKTVTAHFSRVERTLTIQFLGAGHGTVQTDFNGISCTATCSIQVPDFFQVWMTAIPAEGSDYVTDSWTGCSGRDGQRCRAQMSAPRTITVRFELESRHLELATAGTGLGTVSTDPGYIPECPTYGCGADMPYGTLVNITATPKDENSAFGSWSGACTGTDPVCAVTLDADKSAVATFVAVNVETLSASTTGTGGAGGKVTTEPAGLDCGTTCEYDFVRGRSVRVAATPDHGSNFLGWSGACTGTDPWCDVTMDEARSVTASFGVRDWWLGVGKGGTGTGKVTSSVGGIDCGATCETFLPHGTPVTLHPVADPGSAFVGWSWGCQGWGAGDCELTMGNDELGFAEFRIEPRLLTVIKTGNGYVWVDGAIDCGPVCSYDFDKGTTVTLHGHADGAAVFVGWSGSGCSGTDPCVVTMDEAKTVSATFTSLQRTLTVTRDGSGTGIVTSDPVGVACGDTCQYSFDDGASVTLTPTAAAGSVFSGWTGACTGTDPCTVTMDEARTVGATFTGLNRTVSVTKAGQGTGHVLSSPAGIDCGATCTTDFVHGTPVTLTATPGSGSTFLGWTGDCSGLGTCEVVADAARNVGATFASATTTVVTGNPAATVFGESVTFTATVAPLAVDAGAPTGSVTFEVNGSAVATPVLVGGSAQYTAVLGISGSPHSVVAIYNPDTTVFITSQGSQNHTVTQAATNTTVTADPASVSAGQTTVLTAVVIPVAPGAGAPTGTVQFTNGSTNLGAPVALVGGRAQYTLADVTANQTITAVYSGDTAFATSEGNASVTVTPPPPGCRLVVGRVSGNLALNGGCWLVVFADIRGSVTIGPNTTAIIRLSRIKGDLVQNAGNLDRGGSLTLCGSVIGGKVAVARASGPVIIGLPLLLCVGNDIATTVAVTASSGEIVLAANRIGGTVTITNNVRSILWLGGPKVSANIIKGGLACSGNRPVASNGGWANRVDGTRSGECRAKSF